MIFLCREGRDISEIKDSQQTAVDFVIKQE